jgi:hypothetical protein
LLFPDRLHIVKVVGGAAPSAWRRVKLQVRARRARRLRRIGCQLHPAARRDADQRPIFWSGGTACGQMPACVRTIAEQLAAALGLRDYPS